MKHPVQHGNEFYLDKEGDNVLNWLSYWYAIEAIISIKPPKPQNILEIGIGRGVVKNHLKHLGYRVLTCDHDIRLKPNFLADITDLPFKSNSFDCIICCEVLEHLPFEDSVKALQEIYRVTKKHVVISIPYKCWFFSFMFRFFPYKFLEPLFNFIDLGINGPFSVSLNIPGFFTKTPLCYKHYWEMGMKGYSRKFIEDTFRREKFRIIGRKENKLLSYQYFYTLEK